jgi:hypothetical protein
MKTNLREAFLLKISNDALPQQRRRADNMEHLVIVVTQERKFEPVLGRVERNCARACRSVQAMSGLALDTGEVDGVIKCADHAMVTRDVDRSATWKLVEGRSVPLRQAVFDMVERGVDKNACVIPSPRLDPNCLMNKAVL